MLKVGALHYTNAYPLFFALQNKIIPNDLRISWGSPVEINDMLNSGAVDVAMISSVDFLNHRFSYILLSDLGIAGTEQIVSVRLFFKGKTLKLHQSPLFCPGSFSNFRPAYTKDMHSLLACNSPPTTLPPLTKRVVCARTPISSYWRPLS